MGFFCVVISLLAEPEGLLSFLSEEVGPEVVHTTNLTIPVRAWIHDPGKLILDDIGSPPKKVENPWWVLVLVFFSHKWDMRILRFAGGEVWSYSLECFCVVAGARLPLQQDWHVTSIDWKGQKGGLFYLQFLHPKEVMAPFWTIPVQQPAAEVRVQ